LHRQALQQLLLLLVLVVLPVLVTEAHHLLGRISLPLVVMVLVEQLVLVLVGTLTRQAVLAVETPLVVEAVQVAFGVTVERALRDRRILDFLVHLVVARDPQPLELMGEVVYLVLVEALFLAQLATLHPQLLEII
jgi:hypothetical protein